MQRGEPVNSEHVSQVGDGSEHSELMKKCEWRNLGAGSASVMKCPFLTPSASVRRNCHDYERELLASFAAAVLPSAGG